MQVTTFFTTPPTGPDEEPKVPEQRKPSPGSFYSMTPKYAEGRLDITA